MYSSPDMKKFIFEFQLMNDARLDIKETVKFIKEGIELDLSRLMITDIVFPTVYKDSILSIKLNMMRFR